MAKTGVRVFARIRPWNRRELNLEFDTDFEFKFYLDDPKAISIRHPSIKRNPRVKRSQNGQFDFVADMVFPMDSTQIQIFNEVAYSTCEDLLKGYNGTIMEYGLTGSGKTYCMFGPTLDSLSLPKKRHMISKKGSSSKKKTSTTNTKSPTLSKSSKLGKKDSSSPKTHVKKNSRLIKRQSSSKNLTKSICTTSPKTPTRGERKMSIANPIDYVCEDGEGAKLQETDPVKKI